jgi:hypothetical protein
MQRPQETLEQLCAIFPEFRQSWGEEEAPPEDGLVDGVYYEWTHHAVLRCFLDYFSAGHEGFEKKQLERFCAWVNAAVAVGGEMENAVSTCFLEHARQVKINRVLAPYLSREAKSRFQA